jgi:hypothetical protein
MELTQSASITESAMLLTSTALPLTENALPILILLLIAGFITICIWTVRGERRRYLESDEVSHAEEIVEVKWKGTSVFMSRYDEKRWESYTSKHKKWVVEVQKEAIKSGRICVVKDPITDRPRLMTVTDARKEGLV